MSNGEEHDAAYAATVAAVAYAIAALEEEKLASHEKPVSEKFVSENKPLADKLGSQKKPASIDERQTTPPLKSPTKRGESLKRPIEGSKISKWFSGKEPVDDDYDDEQGANVSVRRPLKPAQKKPQGITSDQSVVEKVADSAPSVKKDPSFARKPIEKKGSRRFEQDQMNQQVPPAAPTDKPMSSYSGRGSRVATSGTAISSEAEAMADAWEKEKLTKIKKQCNETMETIAEWETEKKAKARRQKELKNESDSERKRAKALEDYNKEMSRINKVAAASRLTVEEKRRNAERKVREKAERIRSTGKLPPTCGCF
ncbi:remorin 1.4-like isoform X2 [Phragmites australis]|nr:remorin 1.4-like isoform X2 [Phragmites australis]